MDGGKKWGLVCFEVCFAGANIGKNGGQCVWKYWLDKYQVFHSIFEIIYNIIARIFGSKYSTSKMYFVATIIDHLQQSYDDNVGLLHGMVMRMKSKYNWYWGILRK